MSEADDRARLRYLQLKAKAAQASPELPAAEAPAPAEPSGWEALAHAFPQGATMAYGDEAGGLIQALGTKFLPEALGGGSPGERRSTLADLYRSNRNSFRREDAAAQGAHPWITALGNLGGGVVTSPLFRGSGQEKTATDLLGLTKQGLRVGSKTGAAYGLGAGDADLSPLLEGQLPSGHEMLRAAGQTGFGGVLGGALGALAPPVAAGAGAVARGVGRFASPLVSLIRGGYVQPTPEAARLAQQGAKLSLGQMDPSSLFGRTEELAANTATGAPLSALRGKAESSVRDAILKAARAEGAPAPTAGAPIEQQLQELRGGFADLYGNALDREVINPKGTIDAFHAAAGARDIDASPAVRQRAITWLVDQAKALRPTGTGPNVGTVEAKSAQALRTQLRDRIRSLGDEGEDRQLKEIYGRAEKVVTDMLHSQLSPESSQALMAADTGYKNLLSVEDAAKRAFVQNREFTPAQLLQAIRARGATPGLEAVARDAQSVLSPNYTPTGLQGAAVASIPGFKYFGPAWANLANSSPTLAAHALRQSAGPGLFSRALTATGRGIEDATLQSRLAPPIQRTLYDMLLGPSFRGQGDGGPQP